MSRSDAGPDADRIAAAVLASPVVAGLHGGRFGEIGTYLPGRMVTGVRITAAEISVHVVGRYPASVMRVANAVRAAAGPHAAGRPVSVIVEDLDVPAAQPTTSSTTLEEPIP